MRRIILLTATVLTLGGCDLLSAPAPDKAEPGGEASATASPASAFVHSQTEDLSGYYRVDGARVGSADVSLTQLFVGQAQDFRAWEDGQRSATFAPVMLEFQGAGGTTERVLPDSYSVNDGRVRMAGSNASGERVTFDGRMNAGALATARRNLGGGEEPALTAAIAIGDRTWSGVKLSWYGGD